MAERYAFIRKVAQGGFGQVYVAKDTVLGRDVAIKRLLETQQSASLNQAAEAFRKEAMLLATMQHPNIVQIFDFDCDEDGSFVVMELLAGETLKDRLDRGPLSWDTFIKVVRESLDAISAAHSQGILHRDLKPENLFLQRTACGARIIKVLDFGLAKLSQAPSKQTLDQQGNIFGSLYYMAPEQMLREVLDARADLYALGCIYYLALSRHLPFFAEKVSDTMEAHLSHRVTPLLVHRPDINPHVAGWVMRLISRRPCDRPSDTAQALLEFEVALQCVGSNAGVAVTSAAVSPATLSAPAPSPQRRPTARTSPSQAPKVPTVLNAREATRLDAQVRVAASAKRARLAAMIVVPIAGILVLVFLWRSSGSVTNREPVLVAKVPASVVKTSVATAAPLTLPFEDLLAWRFRAGVELWSKGNDGKGPLTLPAREGRVHKWLSVAGRGAESPLEPFEGRPERAPRLYDADVNGPGTKHPYLYLNAGTSCRASLKAAMRGQSPGGPNSKPLGVAVGLVVRANSGTKERILRPVVLTSSLVENDHCAMGFSRFTGQYWVEVCHQGQVTQALVSPEQFRQSGTAGQWVAAVFVWDATRGVARISVRSPNGTTTTATSQPIASGVSELDTLSLGFVRQSKKMDGDIIELAVYRQALDEPSQAKVLNALWDRYFKKR
ncbi:MAG: serine/threonine protein kinase [Roseimicrobium sp.]